MLGRRIGSAVLVALSLSCLVSCSREEPAAVVEREAVESDASALAIDSMRSEGALQQGASFPRVIFLGDSLTVGREAGRGGDFPTVATSRLAEQGVEIEAINAGIGGDTTAGGLARLDWLLQRQPDLLVVELGANDGLRGIAVESIEANLRAIIERAQDAGSTVLLVGMRMPPSHGPTYTREFEAVFPRLAEDLDVDLMPFLLEGVAGIPELNAPDGIHPNRAGHQLIADAFFPYLQATLERARSKGVPVP